MFHKMRWRIALPYIAMVLAVMSALTIYLSAYLRDVYVAGLRAQLVSEAALAADALAPYLERGATAQELDGLAKAWAGQIEARVTFVALDGAVLGDSHEDRLRMDNHLSRPEIRQAVEQGQGNSIRVSDSLGYEMMYSAASAMVDGSAAAVARVARPTQQARVYVTRLRESLVVAALLAAALAALLAILIAEGTVRPIHQLTREATRMANGDLNAPVVPATRDELAVLARAFNHMAGQLRDRMGALEDERRLLATVLAQMADGAVVTDGKGQVRLVNPAAAQLLEANEATAVGRTFGQVTHDYRLLELWQASRERGEEMEATLETHRQDAFVRAIITPFGDEGRQGSLIFLQDLSQVRRLERVRRDFISNVSHELRTPLASLKALVETLRDGALEDPEAARRFVGSMETEVDAMTQIVQELLDLSRVESGRAPLNIVSAAIGDLLGPAMERLRAQAERAGLALELDLPTDLPLVLADVERTQQVVVNLLHNAIKFTAPGGRVSLSANAQAGEVVVSVRDTGIGIASENLERIFERFFKADRARSGGGTGLGLAIAKHVVQAQGGRIWAESVEGHGSTFHFTLRSADRAPSE